MGIDGYDLSLRDRDHLSAVSRSLNVNHPSLLATDSLQIPRKNITDTTWSPIDRRILTLLIPAHKTITVPWLHLDLKAFSFFHLSGAIERIAVHHWDAWCRRKIPSAGTQCKLKPSCNRRFGISIPRQYTQCKNDITELISLSWKEKWLDMKHPCVVTAIITKRTTRFPTHS